MNTELLFELTYILLEKRQLTAKEMAEHFGVSQRTIYRWVDALNLAGVPVFSAKGKGGGIHVSEKYALDKTFFTDSEKQELLSSVQALESLSGNKNSAITKLKAITKSNADWIQVDFSPWNPKMAEIRDIFTLLKTAILNSKKVQFIYFSSQGKGSERTVFPVRIIFKGQAWYLFAFCYEKNDMRFFKLSRMAEIKMLSEQISQEQLLKLQKTKNIFPDSLNGSIYEGYKEQEFPLLKLKIAVSIQDVYRIMDEYKITRISDGNSGEKILEIEIPEFPWLIDWLLSFGNRLTVIEPESIKTKLAQEIGRMYRKWNL